MPFSTPTHGYFVLSPVSLASRDQDGGPSNSMIDIYDLTEKLGTVNSLVKARRSLGQILHLRLFVLIMIKIFFTLTITYVVGHSN